MKKVLPLLLLGLMTSCGGATSSNSINQNSSNGTSNTPNSESGGGSTGQTSSTVSSDQILTVYFSATNHTEGIANLIAEHTSSEKYEILAEVPYTPADLNYSNASCRANQEQNDDTSRPAIGSETIDVSNYSVVFLGYPIWHNKAPRIIYTFLDTYDLSNKTIIPFCTSGSTGITNSESLLRPLEPSATWIAGRRFASSASLATVGEWIDELEIL